MKRNWTISTGQDEDGNELRLITCHYTFEKDGETITDEVNKARVGGPGGITKDDQAELDKLIQEELEENE